MYYIVTAEKVSSNQSGTTRLKQEAVEWLAMPGILIYMVKPGDELWDIARKYHTSIEEICTLNGLKENQEPSPGTPLLVVKKVEGQIK